MAFLELEQGERCPKKGTKYCYLGNDAHSSVLAVPNALYAICIFTCQFFLLGSFVGTSVSQTDMGTLH